MKGDQSAVGKWSPADNAGRGLAQERDKGREESWPSHHQGLGSRAH